MDLFPFHVGPIDQLLVFFFEKIMNVVQKCWQLPGKQLKSILD